MDEALPPVTKGEFGTVLKKLGYVDTRISEERQWKDLRLRLPSEGVDVPFSQMEPPMRLRRLG